MDLLKSICWPLIFILRIHFPPGKSLVTSSSNVGNLHLLVMLVQNKRLYGFLACIFDENSYMCPTPTQKKQSGLALSTQIGSNKAAYSIRTKQPYAF